MNKCMRFWSFWRFDGLELLVDLSTLCFCLEPTLNKTNGSSTRYQMFVRGPRGPAHLCVHNANATLEVRSGRECCSYFANHVSRDKSCVDFCWLTYLHNNNPHMMCVFRGVNKANCLFVCELVYLINHDKSSYTNTYKRSQMMGIIGDKSAWLVSHHLHQPACSHTPQLMWWCWVASVFICIHAKRDMFF